MNPLPDPEFDGQKAWLLFIANLCIHGGLSENVANAIDLKLDFSYFELHSDTVFCLSCRKKLGTLIQGSMNIPVDCHDCSKKVANNYYLKVRALQECKTILGFKHAQRAYNYLLEHNLKLRKGTWHKVSQIN